MIIDAHQHFWKFDPVRDSWITDEMKVIKRDFFPEDLKPLLKKTKIDGCVSVQAAQTEEETHFLLSLAKQHDFIRGVVGWVDLRDPNLEQRLEFFSLFPQLKGFRHIVQSEPRGFLADKKFIEGVKKLSHF